MQQFKTEVWVSFNYGTWSLDFHKSFIFPFAPFYDMDIDEETPETENTTSLKNNDYSTTVISYNADKAEFSINIRNIWKKPVSDDTIDITLEQYQLTGWERIDKTDISALKLLMERNHRTGSFR